MADAFKFRIDHHGSLIRPPELLEARRRHASGDLDDDGLREIEDQAIADVVRSQRQLNASAVTDGDFRREDWRSPVFDAVSGLRRTDEQVDGMVRWIADGELKATGPLVADDVAAVGALTLIPAKATLPSPAYLAAQCFEAGLPGSPWTSAKQLGEALAQIVHEEVSLLLSNGVRYVQLNNPDYAGYLAGAAGAALTLEESIAIDTLAVSVPAKEEGACVALSPGHGVPGDIDDAAAERLLSEIPVDRWILPYHTGSASEARLLRAVPDDCDVCLAVVDPLRPELEDVDETVDRLEAAADMHELDLMAIGTSAGFSDVAGRAELGMEAQRHKLTHVDTFARMIFGNEL